VSVIKHHLPALDFHQAVKLMSVLRLSPETSIGGRWIFEAMAHQILTGNVPGVRVLPVWEMTHNLIGSSSQTKFSVDIQQTRTQNTHTMPRYLPLSSTPVQYYSHLDDILRTTISPGYWVPENQNTALFDSLLFASDVTSSPPSDDIEPQPPLKRRRREVTTVYVFQMATSHGDSEQGVQTWAILKDAMPNVKFVYVLVVPLNREHRTCTWEMPQGWINVSVEVYCLELNIDRWRSEPT